MLIPILEDHDGILLKIEGDSYLVIFRNISKALHASVKMQKSLKIYNKKKSKEEQVLLCVGLGYGKVLKIGDTDVFGEEVNAASKLGEDIAKTGEIFVTEAVKENIDIQEKFSFMEVITPTKRNYKTYRLEY